MTPPRKAMKPTKSESILRSLRGNKHLLFETHNTVQLRRSPRIPAKVAAAAAAAAAKNGKQDENNTKRESFRKNISDFFANVTRSILRIKG